MLRFVSPLCLLAGAALLLTTACPLSSPSQSDAPLSLGLAPSAASPTAATSVEPAPKPAGGTAAAADPTAAGAVLSSPNAVASPNRVIIGQAPPGVATGATTASPSTSANTVVGAPPAAGSPNAVGGTTAAPAGSVAPAPTQAPMPATPPSTAAGSASAANTMAAPPTGNAANAGTGAGTTGTGAATPAGAAAWANLGFTNYSGKLGNKVVALTFDDGPDGAGTGENNTAGILDFLRDNQLKATFFVCGNVWTDLSTDALAQADLKRIVAEGHDLGSHTLTHPHLDTITPVAIHAQFSQNLSVARTVLGRTFSFDKVRAPFGFPFQTNNPNVFWVAPVTAKYGVHIGWGIDTDDWKCAQNNQDSNCILNNLQAQIAAGASGPILMHSVYKLTLETLPQVVAYLRSQGYSFVTAEQMVVDKYGKSSAALMADAAAANFPAAQVGAAAAAECSKNRTINVLY